MTRLTRKIAKATVTLAFGLGLAGCGFTPLYATNGLAAGMSSIEVKVPHGRLAYLLSESLDDDLARDRDRPAVYRLDLTVGSAVFSRGLNVDETAAYYEEHVTVDYRLVEIATGRVLKTGTQPVEVTYAATDLPYAGIAAQADAQERAANQAADRIRTDLGVYFATEARN
jgi:LPS-assembly lipoprotein